MLKELLIEKTPKYTEILPISQKRISYRPFVVREEKNLMIAKETSSFENLMTTIQEVINSCANGLPNDDCKSIPFCDLEYIFLKIREKSLGESVECVINCPETNEQIPVLVDLRDVKVTNKNNTQKIKIDTTIHVVMKQPSLETYLTLNRFEFNETEDGIIDLLALCVEEIHSKDEVYQTKDLKFDEVKQFIESLTAKQFKNLLNFIKDIPTVTYTISYTTSDGVQRKLTLKGFSDFLELFLVMPI